MMAHTPLPEPLIGDVARRFRALGEPARLRILRLLTQGEQSVTAIADATGAGQSNTSRHLQALHECGLIERRREGNVIYYRIGDPMLLKLCDLVCSSARRQARDRLRSLERAGRRR